MTVTLGEILADFTPETLTDLDHEVAVPVVDFARQGDVMIVPERIARLHLKPSTPVPAEGIALVVAEFGGNAHTLVVDGEAFFDRMPSSAAFTVETMIEVGALEISQSSTAYLIHPEHGAIGLLPGRYSVRRQREWAEVARLVED